MPLSPPAMGTSIGSSTGTTIVTPAQAGVHLKQDSISSKTGGGGGMSAPCLHYDIVATIMPCR